MRATDIISTPFTDAVFTINIPYVKFGLEATREAGYEAKRLGVTRALVMVDPGLEQAEMTQTVLESLRGQDIGVDVVTEVRVEPEDTAILEASRAIKDKTIDGFVSVGGGSTIDTAKILNLLYTHPAELTDYINQPIGKGIAPPGPLLPHIAIPTTAGTGSENTAVAIFDITQMKVKSGISHPYLRPDIAIVDPLNTVSLPPMVTASSGLDVFNHAIESFTAHPYTAREKVAHPSERPVYAGSTPVADIFATEAISWVHRYLRRAVAEPRDIEARYYLMLGASIAGVGFGHAGVHIPHAMGYPISGMVRQWAPKDYEFGYALSPHGISTAIPAAYVFRFLVKFDFERFEKIAEVLDIKGETQRALGDNLYGYYLDLLSALGIPTTLKPLGFGERDLDKLVDGTLAQQRLVKLAPKRITREEVKRLFEEAISGT
ncbi:MAG TPA: hydroxyacid-oxoacid transhydrogenase [Gammaproteobacteria bacterium]|nr:hydroxyacid-oxoacid transhydrogenase [Gammaproteobacteria bacterium]